MHGRRSPPRTRVFGRPRPGREKILHQFRFAPIHAAEGIRRLGGFQERDPGSRRCRARQMSFIRLSILLALGAIAPLSAAARTDSIVLGGGCFWCLDASYKLLPGVTHVTSGYAGGTVAKPTYEQVSGMKTGHA